MSAVLHDAVAQLDRDGKALEQKLHELRTFVRVADQYGVPYKREISENIRKLCQEIQYNETARNALRNKAVTMQVRVLKEQAMSAQMRPPLSTTAPLRTASTQSLAFSARRPGAPVYPLLADDDDFNDMAQFERDVAFALGGGPVASPSGVGQLREMAAAASGGPPVQLAEPSASAPKRYRDKHLEDSDDDY